MVEIVVAAVARLRGRIAEVEAVGLCWVMLRAGCQGQAKAKQHGAAGDGTGHVTLQKSGRSR